VKRSSGGGEPQCFNLCVASLSLQRLLQPAELRLGFWQQDGNGAANLVIFDTELDDDNLDREPEESLQEDSGEAGALADEPQADLDAPPPKRCRGRPPGLPKTGGRQKGSPRSYGKSGKSFSADRTRLKCSPTFAPAKSPIADPARSATSRLGNIRQ
jgi:hypothetical protein